MDCLKVIAIILLVSCNARVQPLPIPNKQILQDKFNRYVEYSKQNLDPSGWLQDISKCDGLTHQALYSTATDIGDPMLAEREPGLFLRHHDHSYCWPNNSGSETSRDNYLSLYHYLLKKGSNVDEKGGVNEAYLAVKRIIKHGNENIFSKIPEIWTFGKGSFGALIFNPAFIATTYELSHKLGGPTDPRMKFPQLFSNNVRGYRKHLAALHIYLLAKIRGYMLSNHLNLIMKYSDDNIDNAMFSAIASKYSDDNKYIKRAEDVLLDEKYFPDQRAPTSNDRCNPYLWMREGNHPGWKPCDENKTFSGADFLWASSIILRLDL
jgi:hypothetical protein